MNIRQLEYFVTLSETLSFTKTSQVYFVSQTAVTNQIKALEDQLGVKLFLRDKRNVSLTPVGKVYLSEVKAVLKKLNDAQERIKLSTTGMVGMMKIGYVMGYEKSDFSNLMHLFFEAFPNVSLKLLRSYDFELKEQILNGNLDIVFTTGNHSMNNDELELKHIKTYAKVLVVHPSSSVNSKSIIHSNDIKSENVFMYNRDEDPESILLRVSANMGMAILPEYCVKYSYKSQFLSIIPFEDTRKIDIYAIWNKRSENPILEKFLELL